jgi:hypothetical protein
MPGGMAISGTLFFSSTFGADLRASLRARRALRSARRASRAASESRSDCETLLGTEALLDSVRTRGSITFGGG